MRAPVERRPGLAARMRALENAGDDAAADLTILYRVGELPEGAETLVTPVSSTVDSGTFQS